MHRFATLIGSVVLVAAGAAQAAESHARFRGYAYDLKSGAFLYTELHDQRLDGERWLGGTIDYVAADGSRLGHKDLDFSQDPHVPRYRLELEGRGGYVEGIEAVTPDGIELYKQGYGERQPTRVRVKRKDPMTADSGFHAFIRDHFARLLQGGPLTFRFAVAGNLDTFKFRARRIEDGRFEDRPVVRFRVEPDSLLRMLVDPLELAYEPGARKLVEYRGVSNVHDPSTGEPYNVRIIYPTQPPADAPRLPAS